MSKITNLIFKGARHYVTSRYGWRRIMKTKGGYTNSFHNGTDYGTNGIMLAQYAIEDGTVLSCGTDRLGGKFVWVKYPRINVKMLHYHLSSVNCTTGQRVTKGTLLGRTGMTGKATGVHLHLSIVNLSNGQYVNPETFAYSEKSTSASISTNGFLPARGYFKYGDNNVNVGKIASFMRKTFPRYTPESALGNLYGPRLMGAMRIFQKNAKADGRYNGAIDGLCGSKTLKALVSYGFKY